MNLIPLSTDLDLLKSLLAPVCGLPCIKISAGYPELLYIDLGAPTKPPSTTGYLYTPYVLCTESTDCRILLNRRVFWRLQEEWEIVDHAIHVLRDRTVESLTVTPEWGLRVEFSGDAALLIEPTPEDAEAEWPYWSLYRESDNLLIEVGPHHEWSMLPFDQRRFQG
jgi:hypothetical protein